MNKANILEELIVVLLRLVALLALDPRCPWIRKFESDLQWAQRLKGAPLSTNDLADLSVSIRHVYGGMGSFSDYAPAIYDPTTRRYTSIPGTDDFDSVQNEVFNLALKLGVSDAAGAGK